MVIAIVGKEVSQHKPSSDVSWPDVGIILCCVISILCRVRRYQHQEALREKKFTEVLYFYLSRAAERLLHREAELGPTAAAAASISGTDAMAFSSTKRVLPEHLREVESTLRGINVDEQDPMLALLALPPHRQLTIAVNWLSVVSNCLTYFLRPSQVLYTLLFSNADFFLFVLSWRTNRQRKLRLMAAKREFEEQYYGTGLAASSLTSEVAMCETSEKEVEQIVKEPAAAAAADGNEGHNDRAGVSSRNATASQAKKKEDGQRSVYARRDDYRHLLAQDARHRSHHVVHHGNSSDVDGEKDNEDDGDDFCDRLMQCLLLMPNEALVIACDVTNGRVGGGARRRRDEILARLRRPHRGMTAAAAITTTSSKNSGGRAASLATTRLLTNSFFLGPEYAVDTNVTSTALLHETDVVSAWIEGPWPLILLNVSLTIALMVLHNHHLFFVVGSVAGYVVALAVIFLLGMQAGAMMKAVMSADASRREELLSSQYRWPRRWLRRCMVAVRSIEADFTWEHLSACLCSVFYFVMLLDEGDALWSSHFEFMRWYGATISLGLTEALKCLAGSRITEVGGGRGAINRSLSSCVPDTDPSVRMNETL